jgi:hypothetical protein
MAEDNASEPAVIWLFTSLIVVASAALIGRTVWLMDRGFDFTDQSFYLMSIQRPADYELIYGLWGYALKPLYELAGGSVACLRRIGAVILVGSGCLAGMVVASEARLNWRQPARIQILAVCAVLPLTYYTLWVPTPAYNWFALLGGLAIFKAILLLHTPDSTKSSAVWAAIAAVLAAFARPHNAVGYGVLYLMAVLLVLPTAKARVTQIVWTAAATVVATLAIASLLPVAGIFKQLSEYDAIFGMSHPIAFSFVDQQLVFLRDAKAWLLSPVLFGAIIFMRRGGRNIHRNIHGGLRALLIAAALAVMLGAVLSEILSPNINRVGARTAALAFAALILAALKEDVDLRLIKLLAVAAFIPWAATLGSSNPVHQQLPFFFGLWIAIAFAALVISVQTGRAAVTATSVMALCLIFLDINFGLSSPFRLASPLAMQNVPTQTGWGSELKLDRKTNVFIRGLRDAARQGGFCQGCLAIDLTGVMPGAVFVMDGRMPIFPWLFSSHLAQEYLKRLGPERLAKSWLITGAREALSIQQENELGITFQRYRLIAELHHPLDDSPVRVYAPNAPAD